MHELGTSLTQENIFFLEALTIVSALQWVVNLCSVSLGCRIAIHTGNANTIAMFDSPCAQPPYNPLLVTSVDLALKNHVCFQVFHIPGEQNSTADTFSHGLFNIVHTLAPSLQTSTFIPPQLMLGAAWI